MERAAEGDAMTAERMRRYWLFGGGAYYPSGGFGDFIASYSYLDEATDEGSRRIGVCDDREFDWWHVFDAESEQIVAESERRSCYGESLKGWKGT